MNNGFYCSPSHHSHAWVSFIYSLFLIVHVKCLSYKCPLKEEPSYENHVKCYNDDLLCVPTYEKKQVNASPGQLGPQFSDLQAELLVHVFTLSHRPQQAAVLSAQLALSVLQFGYCA